MFSICHWKEEIFFFLRKNPQCWNIANLILLLKCLVYMSLKRRDYFFVKKTQCWNIANLILLLKCLVYMSLKRRDSYFALLNLKQLRNIVFLFQSVLEFSLFIYSYLALLNLKQFRKYCIFVSNFPKFPQVEEKFQVCLVKFEFNIFANSR